MTSERLGEGAAYPAVHATTPRAGTRQSGNNPMDANQLTSPRMPSVSHLNLVKNGGIVGALSSSYTASCFTSTIYVYKMVQFLHIER